MQTELTVLMPNYNNELFLKECINSILNQTFSKFIFLIIDDGSTDKSVEIIKNYNDERIVLIEKKSNSGIVDTLNIGLDAVTTKYFIRMDGDDVSTADRFEILYNYMESHPQIGVCGSDIKTFGNSNEVWKYYTDSDKLKARLIFNGSVGHAASIFRTSILKTNKIYYSNCYPYMEDYEIFSRLKKFTSFANINKPLYHYRILEHNSTIKNKSTAFERYRKIFKYILSELEIEATDNNIETHLDFFIKPDLSKKVKEYKQWMSFLIAQNKKTKIYPEEAFKELLFEKWNFLFFKIIKNGLSQIITYWIYTKHISISQVRYLLGYYKLKITSKS